MPLTGRFQFFCRAAAAAALLLAGLAAPAQAAPGRPPVPDVPALVAPLAPQGCDHFVSSPADDGPGTLRQALNCPNPTHVVTFTAALAGNTILLTTGEIVLTDTITIDGSGAPGLILDAGNSSRIFDITANGTVTLTHLVLQHGLAPSVTNGGALAAGGSTALVLDSVRVLSSTAPLGVGGGLYAGYTATFTNTDFISNTSLSHAGGAWVELDARITNGRFERNTCTDDPCQGGALNVDGLTLSGTQFISNTSVNQGGAVWTNSAAQVSNALYQGNHCLGTGCLGGGLFVRTFLTLSGTDFITNTSLGAGGGALAILTSTVTNGRFERNACLQSGCFGGGLWISTTLNLTGTQFITNTSVDDFGGAGAAFVATLTGARFQGNRCTATDCRGGGFGVKGPLTLLDTDFISNTAVGVAGGAFALEDAVATNGLFQYNRCTDGGCLGGGLAAGGALTLTSTDFMSNASVGSGGGAFTLFSATLTGGRFLGNHCTGSGCSGGGLNTDAGLTLTGTDFISNTSLGSGGGVYVVNAAVLTGGRFLGNQCTAVNCSGGGLNAGAGLTLAGTQLISNTSVYYGGGAISSGPMLVADGRVQGNSCSDPMCFGGGLMSYNTLSLTNTDVISNHTTWGGSGATSLAAMLVSNSHVQDNDCTLHLCQGGGLFANDALTLTGTSLSGNISQSGGGGAVAVGPAFLANDRFEDNACQEADCLGGGLWARSSARVFSSSFSDNQAAGRGGGVAITGTAQIMLANVTLSHNMAGVSGGGLYAGGTSQAGLWNVTAADNQAPSGAGLRAQAGTTIGITNTLFANNGAENCSATVAVGSHNLQWPATCAPVGPATGFFTADPQLLPLALNAPGATLTYALLNTSPARDHGDPASCAGPLVNNLDQRGVARPIDGDLVAGAVCDIGAFEAGPPVFSLFLPLLRR